MNKKLIALAVSGIISAGTASAADIFKSDDTSLSMGGRAEARMSIQDRDNYDDVSRVRLNFLGKTQIDDNLYGVGFYEGEFKGNDRGAPTDADSDDLTNRYLYAGIGGNFGEITYGKNDGALGVLTDFTDIMAYHGNSAAYKLNVADRASNMLTYSGSFADFDLKASYRFEDSDNNRDGFSLSGIWNVYDTGLRIGLGYAQQDVNACSQSEERPIFDINDAGEIVANGSETVCTATKDDDQNEFMATASWEYNNFYTAFNYVTGEAAEYNALMSETDDSDVVFDEVHDIDGYEWAGAYTWGETVFTTTWNYQEVDDEAFVNNLAFDATYYFKPNFRVYASYNYNVLDKGDARKMRDHTDGKVTISDTSDDAAVGIRYDF